MRIGITERGDAGIDLSWAGKLQYGNFDGAILITKNITKPFMENVLRLYDSGKKIIVHCTCTGWGGTLIEPNVPQYRDQIDHLKELCDDGLPMENCVLRIDPIMPTENGIKRVREVLVYAKEKGILPGMRIRISIFDEYKHVKERFKKLNVQPCYPDGNFQASTEQFKAVAAMLAEYDYTFYTCAEPKLLRYAKHGQVKASGCVSEEDLKIMGLPVPDDMAVNMQHRGGCLCLYCKTEMLTQRKQCPHKCAYCYWKDC